MLINRCTYVFKSIFLSALIAITVAPQNLRVNVGKRSEAIPKACESIVPASLDDVAALTLEVNCRGAGDMMGEYTYTTTVTSRSKDKKGLIKQESITYEVYIPTLKEGMTAKGILLETARNGVPVSEKDLEKERLKAGERLEKEDKKIAEKSSPEPKTETTAIKGMNPIGMYASMGANRSVLGVRRGGATLRVQTFLEACDLKFLRRAQNEGREVLVFSFTPRPNIPFDTNEKYVAQLTGEIWIDVADHIVSRVTGWPANAGQSSDKPPAIHAEMVRLPTGVWLPGVSRINGLDYPNLFDNIVGDTDISYGEYKRFVTDVKRSK